MELIYHAISRIIDDSIKKIWLEDIPKDFQRDWLYREASLQNSFYYHLRNELGDSVLQSLNIYIYPEYKFQNKYGDMAVLYRVENQNKPVAIIEFKYLKSTSDKLFQKDVNKILKYIENDNSDCKFYLGFIQDVEFDYDDDYTWLSDNQISKVKGRVTELIGGFSKTSESPATWFVKEH